MYPTYEDYPTHELIFKKYDKLPHPCENTIIDILENKNFTTSNNIEYCSFKDITKSYIIDNLDIWPIETLDLVIGDIWFDENIEYRKYVLINNIFNYYENIHEPEIVDPIIKIIIDRISSIPHLNTSLYYDVKKILENLLQIEDVSTLIVNKIEKLTKCFKSYIWMYFIFAELTYEIPEYIHHNTLKLKKLINYLENLDYKQYNQNNKIIKTYYKRYGSDIHITNNYVLLYENRPEFLKRINKIQKAIYKITNYYQAQDILSDGLNKNSDETLKDEFMKKLLLAGDYADASQLRTKYFWYLYHDYDLMDPCTPFDIDLDTNTIIYLSKILKNE